MEIPVLIQPVPGKGFVARAGSPFDWTAEGATEAEAMAKLQVEAKKCIDAGCTVSSINVPAVATTLATHPLMQWAGTQDPNDPMVQEWKRNIEENRREIDATDAVAEDA